MKPVVIWCAATLALSALALLGPAATVASADSVTSPDEVTAILSPPVAPPSDPVGTNLILNGDFEDSTIDPGCNFNLANDVVTAGMANITAFGDAEEIDVMNDGTDCGYAGPPQSGVSKLALHRAGIGGPVDAFSFELSEALVTGETYTIEFYAWANRDFDPDIGAVEIGASSSAASFGALVFTSGLPTETEWTLMSGSFAAPSAATYLTVRVEANADAWNHIDNFSLIRGTSPTTEQTWGTIKTLYR